MSLRVRLLLVIAILLATYVAAAIVIVSTQQSLLIEQADKRLRSIPPLSPLRIEQAIPAGSTSDGQSPAETTITTDDTRSPFSDVFIGRVDAAGNIYIIVSGALLSSMPDIGKAVSDTGGVPGFVTIAAVEGSTQFRASVSIDFNGTGWIVAAQPLDETKAAIARLERTLWIAGAVFAVVLGVVFWWVQRLGIRPIARVTAAAEAIAAGDRAHRVEIADQRTEAGKLGVAFNVMLDERDLSERRLRQFIADASHELRTPLTSIRGYLELYRQDAFPEKGQLDDAMRRLSAESARMYGLVEDLLALASLDEGRPLREDRVDLGQIVRDAGQDAQAVQADRAITVNAPDSGPVVVGDSALIVQLVGILVSNALAHTPVSASLSLSARTEMSQAVIAIADQGPGLEAEAASRVFDRFWRGQGGRTRTKRPGGSGLGLSIARSIVEAHGGSIGLETAPGKGSVFTVRLPMANTGSAV